MLMERLSFQFCLLSNNFTATRMHLSKFRSLSFFPKMLASKQKNPSSLFMSIRQLSLGNQNFFFSFSFSYLYIFLIQKKKLVILLLSYVDK